MGVFYEDAIMSTTRLPNGVTNVTKANPMGMMGQLDPTKYHTYFDDFDTYTAADWTITETGVATQALTDADGGQLLITNAGGGTDASWSQKVGESFLVEAGKKLWFKAKFQVSDATQSNVVMGLQITDTTPVAVSDGIFFRKDDGDTNIDFIVTKDTTPTTQLAVATLADATDITLSFYYNGVDAVEYYANDVYLGASVVTNLPDDEILTISYGIQDGEAVAKTMTLDYIFAAKER